MVMHSCLGAYAITTSADMDSSPLGRLASHSLAQSRARDRLLSCAAEVSTQPLHYPFSNAGYIPSTCESIRPLDLESARIRRFIFFNNSQLLVVGNGMYGVFFMRSLALTVKYNPHSDGQRMRSSNR